MTEQDFYDIVLSIFNLRRTVDDGTQEDILIKTYKPLALVQCARMSDWTFLTKTTTFENGDVKKGEQNDNMAGQLGSTKSFREFHYQYFLPKDLIKVLYLNGEYEKAFQVVDKTIWTLEPLYTLDYISTDTKNAPDDYMYIVAYYTAVSISQMLDSAGTAMQRAQNLMQIAVQGLLKSEADNKRKPKKDLDSFIFDGPNGSGDRWH